MIQGYSIFYLGKSDGTGDFSFFEEEAGGREREEKGDAGVLSLVAKRKREIRWRGKVRVIQELAGGESTERGASGGAWGVVREGVYPGSGYVCV